MKRSFKNSSLTVLAGALCLALLSGCGAADAKIDGTKTVATVNGEAIPMGVLSLYARRSQAQTEAMYRSFLGSSSNIWSTVYNEETGETYGDEALHGSLESLELMYILKEKAADYGVVVTDADKDAIAQAAAAFMEANSAETIEALGVTEEQVQTFLELMTYQQRMYDPVVSDADTDVDEAEAQQSSFSYSAISFSGLEDDAKEEVKTKAQEALDAFVADPAATLSDVVKAVDESYTASTGSFTTFETDNEYLTNSFDDAVIEALRTLEDGQVYSELVEASDRYYILRMDKKNDEERTLSKIESEISSIESAFYEETTQGWVDEAEITVDDKVLETLTISDSHSFTLIYSEDEEVEEETELETTEVATGSEETTEAATEGAVEAETAVEGETEMVTEAAVEVTTEAAAEAQTEA